MYFLQVSNQTPAAPFWWTVIAAMIGSSVIAAIVTFFATKKLKGTEFSYDYKKYIVEKRKKAYNKVEEVIHHYKGVKPLMDTILISSKAGGDIYDATAFSKLKNKIISAKENELWLTNEIGLILSVFESKTENYIAVITSNLYGNLQRQNINHHHSMMYVLHNLLISQYFDDMFHLSNVDDHAASKKKGQRRNEIWDAIRKIEKEVSTRVETEEEVHEKKSQQLDAPNSGFASAGSDPTQHQQQ